MKVTHTATYDAPLMAQFFTEGREEEQSAGAAWLRGER
jgi:hypothetical protein